MDSTVKLWGVSKFGVSELSPFVACTAPWGGDDLVEAKDRREAHEKWLEYCAGRRTKCTSYRARPYPIKGVIV